MDREPYASRYSVGGSLRALDRQATYPEYPQSNSYKNYAPGVDDRHTSLAEYRCSSRMEPFEYTSSHGSAPSSHASQSPHISCPSTNYAPPLVQSRQTPELMGYNVRSDRVSYTRRISSGYDNTRIDRYENSMTHHEWETQRFTPVGPPISSSQSYDDQRVRQGSNSRWAPGYTSSTNAREGNTMPYEESNREQSEQVDYEYRDNIYGEKGLSPDEESQPDGVAYYPRIEEVGDHPHGNQDSNYFDDEYEEDPDQYAGDCGFDNYGDNYGDDNGDDYVDDCGGDYGDDDY